MPLATGAIAFGSAWDADNCARPHYCFFYRHCLPSAERGLRSLVSLMHSKPDAGDVPQAAVVLWLSSLRLTTPRHAKSKAIEGIADAGTNILRLFGSAVQLLPSSEPHAEALSKAKRCRSLSAHAI